jgi:hypothetical protein
MLRELGNEIMRRWEKLGFTLVTIRGLFVNPSFVACFWLENTFYAFVIFHGDEVISPLSYLDATTPS